jgi:hypothetical protein
LYESATKDKQLSEQGIPDDEANYTVATNSRVTDYFIACGLDFSTSIVGLVKKFFHPPLLSSKSPFCRREARYGYGKAKAKKHFRAAA